MIEDEGPSERNTRTVSPPTFARERNGSVEFSASKRKFHERNLEHLKTITDKNTQRAQKIEEEKRKLEIARQRLAQKILKRNAESKVKTIKEASKEDESSNNTAKVNHKSRNLNYILNLQESNKAKQLEKEEKEEKKLKNIKKLRDDLGLSNINSKIGEIEVKKLTKPKEEEKKLTLKAKDEEKPIKKEENIDFDDKKKGKKSDEQSFQRLIQPPKRFSGIPIITDMSVFKKKNNLSEKDKIFIINGCYPDIKRALIKRSKS